MDIKRTLEEAIKSNGLDTEIRNIVYHLLRSSVKCEKYAGHCVSFTSIIFPYIERVAEKWKENDTDFLMPSVDLFPQNDSLNYLRRSGVLWERRVRKSLNSMCNELEVTLQGQLRTCAEREEFLAKWDELSNHQIGISQKESGSLDKSRE